jgi:hypothetical protein
MIYLNTPPTGLIKHLYHAILTAVGVHALKEWSETNLREKVRSVLMNNQVKAIVVYDVQNVLKEFLEIMKWLADSTSTKIIFLSTSLLDMPTIMVRRSKILELQTGGIETIHMIKKGQVECNHSSPLFVVQLIHQCIMRSPDLSGGPHFCVVVTYW